MRTCDAYELLGWALEDAVARGTMEHGEQNVENARAELRILQETASASLSLFKRKHGISD